MDDGQIPTKQSFRIGGLVVPGSIKRNNLNVTFQVTDCQNTINVTYQGTLPDLFREKQGIIVQGKRTNTDTIKAQQVLAKHDENYMPPEVAESIKKHEKQTINKQLCDNYQQ